MFLVYFFHMCSFDIPYSFNSSWIICREVSLVCSQVSLSISSKPSTLMLLLTALFTRSFTFSHKNHFLAIHALLNTSHLVLLYLIFYVNQWSCISCIILNYLYRIHSSQFWNESVKISFIHSIDMLELVVKKYFSKSVDIPLSFKTLESSKFLQGTALLAKKYSCFIIVLLQMT